MSTVWCSVSAAVSASRDAGCDVTGATNGPNATSRNKASNQAVRARRDMLRHGHLTGKTVLPDFAQLAFHLVDLVAQARRLFEAQIAGRVVHLVGEALDEPAQLVAREIEVIGAGRARLAPAPAATATALVVLFAGAHPDHLEDVGDLLAHGLRIDVVLCVVR